MTKQTYASVTESRCECGHMDQLAEMPDSPVSYNAAVQEYCIQYQTPSGATATIPVYHCVLCGGALKESTRHLLFETIPDAEQARLAQLISNLKSVDDVFRAFGQPDYENLIAPASEPSQSVYDDSRTTRSLMYSRLSMVADIHVNAAPNGSVLALIVPKRRN